jgi:uncharacterized membrane protein YidH (DUF202 family)
VANQQEPGERPTRTRLDRPPGERYDQPVQAGEAPSAAGPARGVAWAAIVAVAGAAFVVALGGPLAVSLGLVVVAFLIGRFVALAMRAGTGTTITPGRRAATAVTVAILGILLGQVGIWLYARSEGGVLGLVDYLGQTFGWLVPAQLLVGAAVAWWTAR